MSPTYIFYIQLGRFRRYTQEPFFLAGVATEVVAAAASHESENDHDRDDDVQTGSVHAFYK